METGKSGEAGFRLFRVLKLPLLPIIFFGALLLSRASAPSQFVFDEVHYIPAAKALVRLEDNLNWVHPPAAKLIMGVFWWIFSDRLQILGEPTAFRVCAIFFGLWTLWALRAWMLELGFSATAAVAAMWLTGFNFLWFVQSKTAMLDIFYIPFALWGLLFVRRSRAGPRYWLGWALLGLSMSSKWAAAPFGLLALFMSARGWLERLKGGVVSGVAYVVTFLPLAFLRQGAVSPADLIEYHERMLSGFDSIAKAPHPYASQWWSWPTLIRPMWYTFDSSPAGERCVWAGGNPVLYWTALPFLFVVLWAAFKLRDRAARALAALYWVPLVFWVLAPRKLQLYYYYLAPSLIVGPILVWVHERYLAQVLLPWAREELRETRGWLLLGFTLLCALTFLYFLPIMDARLLAPGRFRDYMWLTSWI